MAYDEAYNGIDVLMHLLRRVRLYKQVQVFYVDCDVLSMNFYDKDAFGVLLRDAFGLEQAGGYVFAYIGDTLLKMLCVGLYSNTGNLWETVYLSYDVSTKCCTGNVLDMDGLSKGVWSRIESEKSDYVFYYLLDFLSNYFFDVGKKENKLACAIAKEKLDKLFSEK